MTRHVLYVGIPLHNPNMRRIEADLEAILGNLSGSGAGLGYRDLDWGFDDAELAALLAEKKVKEYFDKTGEEVEYGEWWGYKALERALLPAYFPPQSDVIHVYLNSIYKGE